MLGTPVSRRASSRDRECGACVSFETSLFPSGARTAVFCLSTLGPRGWMTEGLERPSRVAMGANDGSAAATRAATGATVSRSSPPNACAASSSVSGLHRELRGRAGNRGRLVADPRPRYTAHHDSVHHRDARGDTLHQAAAFPRNLAAPPTPGSAAGWHLGRLARGPLGVRADHELPLSPDLRPGSVVARHVASVR